MSNLTDSLATRASRLAPVWRYRLLLFIVFFALLCGYIVVQINQAASNPSTGVSMSGRPATPHLDPTVVEKLKQLQDNSVSVKALFNQTRDNPFQ